MLIPARVTTTAPLANRTSGRSQPWRQSGVEAKGHRRQRRGTGRCRAVLPRRSPRPDRISRWRAVARPAWPAALHITISADDRGEHPHARVVGQAGSRRRPAGPRAGRPRPAAATPARPAAPTPPSPGGAAGRGARERHTRGAGEQAPDRRGEQEQRQRELRTGSITSRASASPNTAAAAPSESGGPAPNRLTSRNVRRCGPTVTERGPRRSSPTKRDVDHGEVPASVTTSGMLTTQTTPRQRGQERDRAANRRSQAGPRSCQAVADGTGLEADIPQASSTTGMIIGRRRCVWLTQRPVVRRIDLLQLVDVGVAVADRRASASSISGFRSSKTRVVLGEAAGMDLRAGDDLARAGVDHDHHRDEALLAEDPPVLQVALGDVADRRAVDEDVAAVDLAGDPRDAVDQVDDDAVLGDDDPVGRDAGLRWRASALATMCRISPCTGMHVARAHDVVAVEQLAGARVAGDVHDRVALVDDVGAELGQPVDDPEDGVLVAGDQAGREHHGVTGLDLDPVVVAVRDPGQRRQRLALRAGRDDDDLFGREVRRAPSCRPACPGGTLR